MRKFLVALGVLAFVTAQAQALELKGTGFQIHLKDATSLYTQDYNGNNVVDPGETGNTYIPRASPANYVAGAPIAGFAPDGIAFGDESRSVVMLDQVTYPVPPNQDIPKGAVSGLVYGLKLVRADVVGPVASPIFTTLYFSGGIMEIWDDPTIDNPNGVDGAEFQDTFDPLAVGGVATGTAPLAWDNSDPANPKFPNVNKAWPGAPVGEEDASLFLKTQFVPFLRVNTGLNGVDATTADVTVIVTLNNLAGTGSSLTAYMDVIGGSGAPSIVKDGFPVALTDLNTAATISTDKADLSVAYTTVFKGSTPGTDATYLGANGFARPAGWAQESSDPIKGEGIFIPEPATMSLLGLGLAGLLGYRRRQK